MHCMYSTTKTLSPVSAYRNLSVQFSLFQNICFFPVHRISHAMWVKHCFLSHMKKYFLEPELSKTKVLVMYTHTVVQVQPQMYGGQRMASSVLLFHSLLTPLRQSVTEHTAMLWVGINCPQPSVQAISAPHSAEVISEMITWHSWIVLEL